LYQILKDFAGPIATIIAALAAVCVTGYFAWRQTRIAKEQADLARDELRRDLYRRRFEIFTSIFDIYYAMISWEDTPEQKAAHQRLFMAYHESSFLFPKESGIPDLLKKLNDDCNKVINYKNNPDKHKDDSALRQEQFKEVTTIQFIGFVKGLDDLKTAIQPYLDFSRI